MTFHELLFGYVFYYPFLMAWVWMAGGFAHVLVFERRRHVQADPLTRLPPKSGLTEWPLVSVIVPCHNEAAQIEEVIAQLLVTDTWYTGPGILLSQMEGQHPSVIMICNTPVEDGVVRVWYALMVKIGNARVDKAGVSMARSYQDVALEAFAQDVLAQHRRQFHIVVHQQHLAHRPVASRRSRFR